MEQQRWGFTQAPPGFNSFPDLSKPPPLLWNNNQSSQNFQNSFNNSFNNMQNQFNSFNNSGFNQSFSNQQPSNFSMQGKLLPTPEDEAKESLFQGVLGQIISQLKVIMQRDLQKKMVQTSAFKHFDGWWSKEEDRTKVS